MSVVKDVRRVWQFVNGRKTYICTAAAVCYWTLVEQGFVQPNKNVAAVIACGIAVGLIHKAVKAE